MPNRSVITYIEEGERWDKVKKHMKKNWKKYAVGAAAVGAIGGYAGNEMIKDASRRKRNKKIEQAVNYRKTQKRVIGKKIRHLQDIVHDSKRGSKEYKEANRAIRELKIELSNKIDDSYGTNSTYSL